MVLGHSLGMSKIAAKTHMREMIVLPGSLCRAKNVPRPLLRLAQIFLDRPKSGTAMVAMATPMVPVLASVDSEG